MEIKLGAWKFPSGNKCAATFDRDSAGMGHINFYWDTPPPLSLEDHRFYLEVVLPNVVQLVQSLNHGGQAQ